MSTYAIPFYYTLRANQEIEKQMLRNSSGENSLKGNSSEDEIKMVNFFGVQHYRVEFGQLKPILSAVMEMVSFLIVKNLNEM